MDLPLSEIYSDLDILVKYYKVISRYMKNVSYFSFGIIAVLGTKSMNVSDIVNVILGLIAIGGLIYKLAQVERAIYKAIDTLEDSVGERMNAYEKRLDIQEHHITSRNQLYDMQLNQLEEKVRGRLNRLAAGQQDIQKYLERSSNFQARQYFKDFDPEDE